MTNKLDKTKQYNTIEKPTNICITKSMKNYLKTPRTPDRKQQKHHLKINKINKSTTKIVVKIKTIKNREPKKELKIEKESKKCAKIIYNGFIYLLTQFFFYGVGNTCDKY